MAWEEEYTIYSSEDLAISISPMSRIGSSVQLPNLLGSNYEVQISL